MKELAIEMRKKRHVCMLPECWDEVPAEVYANLAQIYLKGPNRMGEHDKFVRAFCVLTLPIWQVIKKLTSEELFSVIPEVFWVFEELNLSKNLIAEIVVNDQRFIGPADEIANLRFGEFCMAETFFTQYLETKEEAFLDKLLAVLYRPTGVGSSYVPGSADYRGDLREKFNGNTVDHRAEMFAGVDLAVKDGIYLFYASTRWALFDYFPHVFPKKSTDAKATNTNQKRPEFGWMGVFDDLLGDKGRTAETLEDEFLATTLMSLERGQIKWREMKEESKRRSRKK